MPWRVQTGSKTVLLHNYWQSNEMKPADRDICSFYMFLPTYLFILDPIYVFIYVFIHSGSHLHLYLCFYLPYNMYEVVDGHSLMLTGEYIMFQEAWPNVWLINTLDSSIWHFLVDLFYSLFVRKRLAVLNRWESKFLYETTLTFDLF